MAYKTIINYPTRYQLTSDVAANLEFLCTGAELQNLYTGGFNVSYDDIGGQTVERWNWATEEIANEYIAFINANVPIEKTINIVTI